MIDLLVYDHIGGQENATFETFLACSSVCEIRKISKAASFFLSRVSKMTLTRASNGQFDHSGTEDKSFSVKADWLSGRTGRHSG